MKRRSPMCRSAGRLLLCRGAHPFAGRRRREALIDEVEAMGGMTRAVEAGLPKLRDRGGRGPPPGPHRPRRRRDRRRQQIPAARTSRPSKSATSTMPGCATPQIAKLNQAQSGARSSQCRRRRWMRLTKGAARRRQSSGAGDRGGTGPRHGGRNLRRSGRRVRTPQGGNPLVVRRLWQGLCPRSMRS